MFQDNPRSQRCRRLDSDRHRNRARPDRHANPYQETGAAIMERQRVADRTAGPRQLTPRFAAPRRRALRSPQPATPAGVAARAAAACHSLPTSPRRSASTSSERTWPTRTSTRPTRWAPRGPRNSWSPSTAACAASIRRPDRATEACRPSSTFSSTPCATASRRREPHVRYDRVSGRWFVTVITLSRHVLEQSHARRGLEQRHDLDRDHLDLLLLPAQPRQPRRRRGSLFRRRDARRGRQRARHRRQRLRHDRRLPGNDRPRRPQERARLGVRPCSTTWPAYITTTRSAISATTPMSCVIRTTAEPNSAPSVGSAPGSAPGSSRRAPWSARRRSGGSGLQESAIAIITRWRMPPENWCG